MQVPRREAKSARRWLMVLMGCVVVFATGCTAEDKEQLGQWAVPDTNATKQSPYIYELWKWSWVSSLVVGVIVWGLILYAAWRFRRRHHDDVPTQTRYNIPLEIFYTIAPIIMVVVFFSRTVFAQDAVLKEDPDPDHVINIVGQQWSWTFNYTDEEAVQSPNVYESGTARYIPTLYLPVDETTRFNLTSPDVIHSFWIPAFLMKMDVIPGRVNHFDVTPVEEGTYAGKCAELCGVSHSRMIFTVKVVSREDFDKYLQSLEDAGNVSQKPLEGNAYTTTQSGLEENGGEE